MSESDRSENMKPYSCLSCRQRKVKCDRVVPCLNCIRTNKECSFVPPVRGKRKRTKPRESMHARMKRYEDMLRSYGVKIEELESEHSETEPTLITREGTSRYFDNALWTKLAPQHPEVGEDEPVHDSVLFFEPETILDLASLHAPTQALPKLMEIYADRVDPMMKILHLPTFWTALQEQSKHMEAVAFAFYLSAVSTMSEDECQNVFEAAQAVMFSRYRSATRQALINAKFLSTSDIMTLRAYAMFTMCVRSSYSCDTSFVLSGVAIRIARKMGLHRDGAALGLSPFETEMRRRLWWHLVHVDLRTADLLGLKPDISFDTKLPSNIEDEDLDPDKPFTERKGITSIALCLIRCEIIETFRKLGDMRWEVLYSDIPLAKKESAINQLEDRFENKYLQYCDPSNSLHTFASIMIRSSICKMRLFAYSREPTERSAVFANALKLLEYACLVKGGYHGLEKYLWQIGTSYLWNAMLYVLIEIRHSKTGPEVDRAWQLIEMVFLHHPQVFEASSGSVFAALRSWTLEVWDECKGVTQPEFIAAIRPKPSKSQSMIEKPEQVGLDYGFPDLLAFESNPNEWNQWEQLLAEQISSPTVQNL